MGVAVHLAGTLGSIHILKHPVAATLFDGVLFLVSLGVALEIYRSAFSWTHVSLGDGELMVHFRFGRVRSFSVPREIRRAHVEESGELVQLDLENGGERFSLLLDRLEERAMFEQWLESCGPVESVNQS